MSDDPKIFKANIIVFPEDSRWTALALEMDVRGYGDTPEEASKDVVGMLEAQISFAVQMGHLESVWHPADEKYWRMWAEARRSKFVADASGSEAQANEIAELISLSLLASTHRDEWAAASA